MAELVPRVTKDVMRGGEARYERVTRRMSKISEGLVDFARVRKQEAEAVALKPLIEESWSLVAIDEKASAVAFENHVRPDDAVTGNADRLVQVFVNLLVNSAHAIKSKSLGEAGKISIQGCVSIARAPSLISTPQLVLGSCTPSPRKLKKDSTRMTRGTVSVA